MAHRVTHHVAQQVRIAIVNHTNAGNLLPMTELDSRKAAYKTLDRAIEQLIDGAAPDGHIVTDAVLVVGLQSVTAEGRRVGSVGVFLRDGCQPMWISRALLREGLDALDFTAEHCPECSCED